MIILRPVYGDEIFGKDDHSGESIADIKGGR
jgi:hypothetical protein